MKREREKQRKNFLTTTTTISIYMCIRRRTKNHLFVRCSCWLRQSCECCCSNCELLLKSWWKINFYANFTIYFRFSLFLSVVNFIIEARRALFLSRFFCSFCCSLLPGVIDVNDVVHILLYDKAIFMFYDDFFFDRFSTAQYFTFSSINACFTCMNIE